MLVRAKFSIPDILFEFFCTDKAVLQIFERIFDNVCAFITYFSHLRDMMNAVAVVFTVELDLIGETFVKVMGAESGVLNLMNLHILIL